MNKVMFQAKLFKDWKIIMVNSKKDGNTQAMAVNTLLDERVKNKVFFDIVLFGAEAEKIVEQTQKGDLIEVRGEIGSRKYTGRDGNTKWSYSLRVKTWAKITDEHIWDPDEDVPFLGTKGRR